MKPTEPMKIHYLLIPAAIVILLAATAAPLHAAGRVQLELVGSARGSALDFQQWVRVLGQAGIKNVRIRSARPTDQVGIKVHGTQQSPTYVVTGIINSRDELLTPAGRFRRRDAGRLARWLDELARYGPADSRPEKSAFGLSPQQFEQVRQDMSRPVGFSTVEMPRGEAVGKISRRLTHPLQLEPAVIAQLNADKLSEQLSDLSSGTALACVLRPMGYCLVPRESGRGVVYAVVKARPGLEVWPVGWEPEKPRRELLPALFEFRSVNVQGVSAAAVLEAMGKRLAVPVLWDHSAMARHGIDPARVPVAHPRSRTNYSIALRKLLFQAGLKYEIRVDEAGNPLLWISTVKPV